MKIFNNSKCNIQISNTNKLSYICANDMFWDLGYICDVSNTRYGNEKGNNIEFITKHKKVHIEGTIGIKELDAIRMRCAEMGWYL